jgi:preprotein translocase subunit SecF
MKKILAKLSEIYDKRYKELLIFPLVMLILSLAVIGGLYIKTGDFFYKGVSLKGGTTITVQANETVDVGQLKLLLIRETGEDVVVRELSRAGTQLGVIVETTAQDSSRTVELLKQNVHATTINTETTGPSLGESFFREAIIAVLVAFVFMGIVVFAYFRNPVTSSYIILCGLCDILFAWAMTIVLGVKVSTAGIAAMLMLIGYSVDTDILLTTRVMKREGEIFEKIKGALSTGTTMTFAAMAATGIAYLTMPSDVLKQIMMILFFGLVADLWNTWITNVGLLRMYLEKKKNVRT